MTQLWKSRNCIADTGGDSDHVLGLSPLVGQRFAPRLCNLKDRKFHTFEMKQLMAPG